METTLKQRLIGAAVIIALAVIFVPMILDGSGRQESVALNMEVPPDPTFIFNSDSPDPKKLDEIPPIRRPEKSNSKIQVPESSSIQPKIKDKPSSETAEKNKPVQTENETNVSTATQAAKSRVVEAAVNHIKVNPALNAWAVQVAAFGEKDKALALQEKLLTSNLSAFTERSGSGNKVIYRVKVGPELKRENAEKLRDKIQKEHGLEGSFVTKHP